MKPFRMRFKVKGCPTCKPIEVNYTNEKPTNQNTTMKQLVITPADNGFIMRIDGRGNKVYSNQEDLLADVKALTKPAEPIVPKPLAELPPTPTPAPATNEVSPNDTIPAATNEA